MTQDELKAELAQLADENRRLRQILRIIKDEIYFNFSRDGFSIESIELNISSEQNPFRDKAASEGFKNHSFPDFDWFMDAALQTPPTPGLGTAMLRLVEAAKVVTGHSYRTTDPDALASFQLMEMAVQALNKLEAKHEP